MAQLRVDMQCQMTVRKKYHQRDMTALLDIRNDLQGAEIQFSERL